ncbi:MAG: hypothetical protein KC910_06745 [Candidatus Eremiobacteraeota bacterium]|nr:hypothetical protein [Candidatus Eremiobacteraeota bacterium]
MLVDQVHAPPMEYPSGLDQTHYGYYEVSNWDRLLEHLGRLGVSSDVLLEGRITPELLADYQLFYLFFPSQPARPLEPDEIAALEDWVRRGGGLFVAGEHTNANQNAERLNPLLERFGMKLSYATLIDARATFAFGGWDKQRTFADHPITRGIRALALVSAGSVEVDTDHPDHPQPLSKSSPSAFLDAWNPNAPESGYSGNLERGPDEPEGQYAALAAANPGRGRVVVLCDHNAFSNVFLHYGDNLTLAAQSFAWLAQGRLAVPAGYDGRREGFSILMPETTMPSDVMTPQSFEQGAAATSFFTFYTALNRHPDVMVRCSEWLDGHYPAVLLCPQTGRFTAAYLDYLTANREAGSTVIVMVDQPVGEGTVQVLERLGVALPKPLSLRQEVVTLRVGGQVIGKTRASYIQWAPMKGRRLVELEGSAGVVPVVVEPRPGVQLFLQPRLVRNDAFHTASGGVLGTGPLKPADTVVFEGLWAWLDELCQNAKEGG